MAWTKQTPSISGFVKDIIRQIGYLMTEDGYVLSTQIDEDIMLDFNNMSKSLSGSSGWVKQ